MTTYAIMWSDRNGKITMPSDRYDDHHKAKYRIMNIIEAQLTHGATSVCHRTGNSLAKFTNWRNDFVEAWRVTV